MVLQDNLRGLQRARVHPWPSIDRIVQCQCAACSTQHADVHGCPSPRSARTTTSTAPSHLPRPLEVAAVRHAEGHVLERPSDEARLVDARLVEHGVEVALDDALPVRVRLAMADDVDPRHDGHRGHGK